MLESQSEQLNRQGNDYFARGFYTEAYICYARALDCDRTSGDRRALVATLGNLGNICAVSGRREQAQRYYQEVLELQKIVGDDGGIGTTLANLGNLRADAGEWERARAYYLEALDLMDASQDELGKAVLFSDLGLVARETGHYDEALRYYEQSLLLMRRLGNYGGISDAFRMIARTYLLLQRFEDATACCRTSLSIAERTRDELRMAGAWYVMADCCEQQDKIEEAAGWLERVVSIDRKFQLPKLEANVRRLLRLKEQLGCSDHTVERA